MTTAVKITPANHEIEVTIMEGTALAHTEKLMIGEPERTYWLYQPRVMVIREIVTPQTTVTTP